MVQCDTDGGRKHPSAMDMYVGVLHSKLYSPNKDVEKLSYCSKYSAATKSYNRTSDDAPDSFWKEPTSQSRVLISGSFREDSQKAVALPGVDPGYAAKSLRNGSVASLVGPVGGRELRGDRMYGGHENVGLVCQGNAPSADAKCKLQPSSKEASKVSNVLNHLSNEKEAVSNHVKGCGTSGPHPKKCDGKPLPTDPSSPSTLTNEEEVVDLDVNKRHNGVEKCPSFSERAKDGTRSHKSAELSVEITGQGRLDGGPANGTRLYKSGEQFTAKCRVNASSLREYPPGAFIAGNVKEEGYGFADTLSANGGSPTASKDGRRWPSFGSQGSTDSMGGSPTAKDGGRRSSFSNGGSSDGGSPMAKDIWRRSSTGGYGSADSSSSSVGSPTSKDGGRRHSSSSVLNSKEFSPTANFRGMGNIFSGGNIKSSSSKANSNESLKVGDGLAKKFDNVVHVNNEREYSRSKGYVGSSPNGNLGNICPPSNWNGNVSTGNILSHVSVAKVNSKSGGDDTGNSDEFDDPEDIKKAGNEQYSKGHFAEAVALYDKCIALCPSHAPYRSNKAAALTGLGKLVEAVQECEEAIRLDSRYSRAHQRAAQLYLRLGLIESAKRHFQAAGLQADARDMQSLQAVEKHISKCIEARKAGDWKIVLQESVAASVVGADSAPQVLGYKSEALLKLHRPEEAEVVCTEAQRLESSFCKQGIAPDDSFLSILRAHIEMSLGRFDFAIAAAQTAMKIDPRNAEAAGLLRKARAVGRTRTSGNELFNAGKFFEACAAYGEGLESDPTNAVLLCNRAACRSKLGQWEKALEDCDAALIVQPKYIKALMRRANCSLKLERWEDALRDYEVLRKKMPDDMEVARGLFDAQVAIKKARGEEIHKMKFGGDVEEVLDTGHFREVVTSQGLSVVQFFSKRGDRCRQICSFFDQLCKRYPCVHFVKVDVDESPHVAKMDSVSCVPTFKVFKNGHKVKELLSPNQQDLEFAVRQYS
eukprot:c22435_g1_i1 orf=852-3803(-)